LVDFENYLKGVLSQVIDSYKLLEQLKDKPGDLEIISRELAKIIGLLRVIVNKLESNEDNSDKYVKLSAAAKFYLENYSFDREIETMSKLYSGDSNRLRNIRSTILDSLQDKKLIEKVPRIAVVNSEGANTLYELYNGKFEETELRWNKGIPDTELIKRYYSHLDEKGIRPKTKATAIQIGRPSNILKGLRALEYTNGVVTQVSDKEMLDGMSIVGLNGFDCEMASGSTPAGIHKLMKEEIIKKDDVVIGILTGRQKDAMLPVDYHNDSSNRFAIPPKS